MYKILECYMKGYIKCVGPHAIFIFDFAFSKLKRFINSKEISII